ncbi:MAG: cbb3-type cytochrome c oxidase subunit I [Candidatus Kariarchaeaceae archaeon]|jgi:cytochrome c oxidase subunit 1
MADFEHTKEDFRVCPVTTFRVDRSAELLMVANAVIAVLALSVGGAVALLMGLQKIPLDNPLIYDAANIDKYYQLVSIHGFNMLIFWIVWFEIAAGYFVATALLNSKLYSVKLGWGAFALMLIGTLMIEWLIFTDHPSSTVMFTAYHPFSDPDIANGGGAPPMFFLGYILFAVGVLVAGLNFFGTIYKAQKTKSYPHKTLPLTVYGVFIAFVIAVQAILNGAIVMIIAWLNALDVIGPVDADLWKQIFWGFGHTAQYINIAATAAVWYALINIGTGAKPLNEKYSRFAFLMYLIFTVPVATHHLIVDPAYSMPFKILNATILALGLAVPSLIHAFVIPGALEKQTRLKNPDAEKSLFGWIKQMPWDQPAVPAIMWSVVLFGFGGIFGAIQGTYQLNMIIHNTLRVNAHFHLTVVAGTTLAFMGLAYYFIELIPRREIFFGKLKVYQLHLFGVGLAVLSLGMFVAGVQGAPRRTASYDSYEHSAIDLPAWDTGLWILGIGAVIAVAGGALFVFLIVTSLFFGKKLEREGDDSTPIPGPYELDDNGTHTGLEAPGTMVIALLYMAMFAVFYLVSFLILSLGWDVWRT